MVCSISQQIGELNLEQAYGQTTFDILKLTLRTNRQLLRFGDFELIGGLQTCVNVPPTFLQSLYGKALMSGQIYVELRPKMMKMGSLGGMKI